jgi:hypothetical protein
MPLLRAGLLSALLECGFCAGECEEGKVVSFLFGTVVDESSRLLVPLSASASREVEVLTSGDFLEFLVGIVFSA